MKNRHQRIIKIGGVPGTHKICSRCHSMKWECEFQKNAAHSDGLQNVCRECRREERKGELKVIEKRILKLIKKMKASSYSIYMGVDNHTVIQVNSLQ